MISPKQNLFVGDFVFIKKRGKNTLDVTVQPHVLQVVEVRGTGVVILQGYNGQRISEQVKNVAHCSIPLADTVVHPELFVQTDPVFCRVCGSRKDAPTMLLCDICNQGCHVYCLPNPMMKISTGRWKCHQNWDRGMFWSGQSKKLLNSEGYCFPKPGSKTADGSKVMSFKLRNENGRYTCTMLESQLWSRSSQGNACDAPDKIQYRDLVGSSAEQIVHCNLSREGRIKWYTHCRRRNGRF